MAATTLRAALAGVFPTANDTDNANMSDVVGNKTDTTAGNSIVSISKSILAETVVPTADSATNSNIADVIGNKLDTTAGDSLVGLLKSIMADIEIIQDHIHGVAKVYPTLTTGVTVNGGVGAWALGNTTVIVPINTITSQFDIHYINVGSVSANDTYELVLYTDAATTVEVGRVRFTRTAVQSSTSSTPMMTPLIAANSGIWAKLASASGGDNVVISLFYHTY